MWADVQEGSHAWCPRCLGASWGVGACRRASGILPQRLTLVASWPPSSLPDMGSGALPGAQALGSARPSEGLGILMGLDVVSSRIDLLRSRVS